MKKLNTLFTESSIGHINSISNDSMSSKSEVSRAAIAIGLSMISTARSSLTDREFYSYINENQEIDNDSIPCPLGDMK